MILDRISNWKTYLGLMDTLDTALRFLGNNPLNSLPAGQHGALDGKRVYYTVNDSPIRETYHWFEYHQTYIDVHVPLTATERIAICSTAGRPEGTVFNASKDSGLFSAAAVNQLSVPVGWFCICFPDNAHAPCLASHTEDSGNVLRKLIVKAENVVAV
jgi:biofilm protein TabA